MSHTLHCLLILAAAHLLAAGPTLAAPAAPDAATVTCMHHLQVIGRALNAYRRAYGHLPAHLSDLVPAYLKDKAMLHCPADPSPGSPGTVVRALPDPNMPVSYVYEMSADPAVYSVPFGPAPDGKVTWYQQKMAQRAYFGARVPVVRCWHHTQVPAGQTPEVPALSPSGHVFRTITGWEEDPATVPFLLTSLERDLAAGPNAFRRRWSPDAIAGYFVGIAPLPGLRARLAADAAKLAAVPGPFPHATASEQEAAVASLYGAAGDMDEAAAGYQAALRMPGDHTEVALLMVEQDFQAGQPDRGIAALKALQARYPEDIDYTLMLAEAYQRAGQPAKAAQTRLRADQQTVGQPAPDFTFKDTGGKAVHLADLRGKPVLLYFWYYPSAPSRAVAPQIESLKQKYRDQGLTVVSLVPGASHEAIDFAGKTFTYPLLLNAAPAFTSYRISSQYLPTLVLIGPDGKIAARHSGPSPGIEATLEREAAKLLPATTAAP